MAKAQVIIDYSDETDQDLRLISSNVYASLNGNPYFTWPPSKLDTLKDSVDDFDFKLSEARNNDSIKIAKKNDSRVVIVSILHDMAQEVNRQANGDIVKLKSSGFILARSRGSVGPLEAPTNVKVVNGPNPGEISCSVDAHPDAIMYFFYFATVPAPENIEDWRLKHTTQHSKTFKGFKSGSLQAVICAYRGTSDELNFSKPINIYVQ